MAENLTREIEVFAPREMMATVSNEFVDELYRLTRENGLPEYLPDTVNAWRDEQPGMTMFQLVTGMINLVALCSHLSPELAYTYVVVLNQQLEMSEAALAPNTELAEHVDPLVILPMAKRPQ